ncbi:protein NDR1-like [Vicia villosa]|uniref:protein NDR1-like n=1 Tax=Vicia villosa TaxID=3911 RepID=UPI00273B2874|nr:protein NDR1-like [Vicia villosa]
MARERSANLCTCCTSFITSTGLIILFLWLTLRTQQPKCFLQSLYLPSLNKTITSNHKHFSNNNNTVVFNLKLTNTNKDKGVLYHTVYITFSLFLDAKTTRPLANTTLDAFYQGHGSTTQKWSSAEVHGGGVNRTLNGSVFVRVDFATRVNYKIMLFYTKRHRLSGGANVEVNVSTGEKVDPKRIRLGNIPPRVGSQAASLRVQWIALSTFLVSLCFYLTY